MRSLAEQRVQLKAHRDGRPGLELRRIRIELGRPTRHGETKVCLLITLAPEVADAAMLA